jgi:hypothetical protein
MATEHFELVNDGTVARYTVHDWYERETTGPSIGTYRPPIFGYEHFGQTYLVYPVLIRTSASWIGPPVLPVIPMAWFDEPPHRDVMLFKVRRFERRSGPVEPSSVRVDGKPEALIPLQRGKTDAVGTVYYAKLALSGSETSFKAAIQLSDGSSRQFQFVRSVDRIYSPLFSFNGPEPRPALVKASE